MRWQPEVIPEDAGMGLMPASFASAASERIRSGLSPTTMRIFTRGVDSDAERLHELRGGSEYKSLDHRLQLRCLCVESEPAPGEGPERVSDAVVRGFKPAWP